MSTATRAYDYGRPGAVRAAAERGQRPLRGRYTHLGPLVYEQVRSGLIAGSLPQDIAADVGCGVSTVYRVRRDMRQSGESGGVWGGVI